MFRSCHFCSYMVNMRVEGIISHHTLHKLSFWVKFTVIRLIFAALLLVNFIRQVFKLPDNLWKVLLTDISNGIPYLFAFIWPCFDIETWRVNQTLYWSSLNKFRLWWCDSHLFHTAKLQCDVQGDVIVTNHDISVFPNIATTTIFMFTAENSPTVNFSSQNVFQLEQPWQIYYAVTTYRSFMFIITSV